MKKSVIGFAFTLCGLCFFGCTEENPLAGVDEPTPDYCPEQAPLGYQMSGPCCARVSNVDRLDNPQFRVAGITVNRPAILGNGIVAEVIQAYLDQETFNWIIDVTGADADGEISVRTGFGIRDQDDNTFSFDASDPKLAPANLSANLLNEEVDSETFPDTLLLPILDKDVKPGETVDASTVLPVDRLKLINVPFSTDRTCIGTRNKELNIYETEVFINEGLDTESKLEASEFPVPPGEVEAYVKAASADDVFVADLNDKLCDIIACELQTDCNDTADYCGEIAQGDWRNPPDSICDADGCRRNDSEGDDVNNDGNIDIVCDPATECNAWYLNLYFVAQGVEITN